MAGGMALLSQASWAAWPHWAASLPEVISCRGVTSIVTRAPLEADAAVSAICSAAAGSWATRAVISAGGGGSSSPGGKWVPSTWVLARAPGRGRTGPGTKARAAACPQPAGPSWVTVTPSMSWTSSQRLPRARRTSLRMRPSRQ